MVQDQQAHSSHNEAVIEKPEYRADVAWGLRIEARKRKTATTTLQKLHGLREPNTDQRYYTRLPY